jgi:hypothetical protein
MKLRGIIALDERRGADAKWAQKSLEYMKGYLIIQEPRERIRKIDVSTLTEVEGTSPVPMVEIRHKNRYTQKDDSLYLFSDDVPITILPRACVCGIRIMFVHGEKIMTLPEQCMHWSDQTQTHLFCTNSVSARYLLSQNDTYVADSFTIWKIIKPESILEFFSCKILPELDRIIGEFLGIPILERLLSIDDDEFDWQFDEDSVLTGFCVFTHQGEEHVAFTIIEDRMSGTSLLVGCKRGDGNKRTTACSLKVEGSEAAAKTKAKGKVTIDKFTTF